MYSVSTANLDQPVAPMIQHQITEAGPPSSIGVSKVVETDEQTPLSIMQMKCQFDINGGDRQKLPYMIEKANEMVPKFVNSRLNSLL